MCARGLLVAQTTSMQWSSAPHLNSSSRLRGERPGTAFVVGSTLQEERVDDRGGERFAVVRRMLGVIYQSCKDQDAALTRREQLLLQAVPVTGIGGVLRNLQQAALLLSP
jgi:hypothetical protein